MSDPAFKAVEFPPNAIPITEVPHDKNAIYLFDFDGVAASGIEDTIYKLPEYPGELENLKRLAERYTICSAEMEPRYQRHLVFQEAARRFELLIEPGPGIELAKWASSNARMFILTARSGWSATSRVRDFVETHLHPPIELYQLGRTSKALQVTLLCQKFPDATVYYIEDSPAHLKNASKLDLHNLELSYCFEKIPLDLAEALYQRVLNQEMSDA